MRDATRHPEAQDPARSSRHTVPLLAVAQSHDGHGVSDYLDEKLTKGEAISCLKKYIRSSVASDLARERRARGLARSKNEGIVSQEVDMARTTTNSEAGSAAELEAAEKAHARPEGRPRVPLLDMAPILAPQAQGR